MNVLSAVPAGGASNQQQEGSGQSMADQEVIVIGGVDTHKGCHVAAVLDHNGGVLGSQSFPATASGYQSLLDWMRGHGRLLKVGVEGTGSYGAGLTAHFRSNEIEVLEVNRPNRQMRRRRGKNDTVDAIAAARAALSGQATAVPKSNDGPIGSLKAIRVAFVSLRETRTKLINQMHAIVVCAPAELRSELQKLNAEQLIARCSRFRRGELSEPLHGAKTALRALGRQCEALDEEVEELRSAINELTAKANPALLSAKGVGPDVASILLIVAGDNPERLRSEAAFAALCGVSPIEASSGKNVRHRLNRGGDRRANHAFWRIVMVRLSCDERTKAYVAKRTAEGKSIKEIMRCLKRHIAREVFRLLTKPVAVPLGAELRESRKAAKLSLQTVADQLNTWPIRVSEIERGVAYDSDFATRYQDWLRSESVA